MITFALFTLKQHCELVAVDIMRTKFGILHFILEL